MPFFAQLCARRRTFYNLAILVLILVAIIAFQSLFDMEFLFPTTTPPPPSPLLVDQQELLSNLSLAHEQEIAAKEETISRLREKISYLLQANIDLELQQIECSSTNTSGEIEQSDEDSDDNNNEENNNEPISTTSTTTNSATTTGTS